MKTNPKSPAAKAMEALTTWSVRAATSMGPAKMNKPKPKRQRRLPASACWAIEEMRLRGFVVRLDNGLDGTWEATFYRPVVFGNVPNQEADASFGAGRTLLQAVREAKAKSNAKGQR